MEEGIREEKSEANSRGRMSAGQLGYQAWRETLKTFIQ